MSASFPKPTTFTETGFTDIGEQFIRKINITWKPANDFQIGEKRVEIPHCFGDDSRVMYCSRYILFKKGRKYAYWGFQNGTEQKIMSKTLLTDWQAVEVFSV